MGSTSGLVFLHLYTQNHLEGFVSTGCYPCPTKDSKSVGLGWTLRFVFFFFFNYFGLCCLLLLCRLFSSWVQRLLFVAGHGTLLRWLLLVVEHAGSVVVQLLGLNCCAACWILRIKVPTRVFFTGAGRSYTEPTGKPEICLPQVSVSKMLVSNNQALRVITFFFFWWGCGRGCAGR